MNCQQFTNLIVEAARGQMSDAAARDGAMRHADVCASCAVRLAQEQSLTDALRAVTSSLKETSAPARVEAKLLTAFQESLANSNAATANASPAPLQTRIAIRAQEASNLRSRRFAVLATAIAASLVLVAFATLYQESTQITPPSSRETTTQGQPSRLKDAPPVDALVVPSPALATSGTAARQPEREPLNLKRRIEFGRAPLKLARDTKPRMLISRQVIDGGNAIIEASESEAALNDADSSAVRSNEAERVTEFISLVAGAPAATPLEGGQLVRVQLPRAALASLGLPLNVERENESVKADVLLGNDGLARAIRFVR